MADDFSPVRARDGNLGALLLREYSSTRSGIALIYRALDLLVERYELTDAALVIEGSELGAQVFLAGRRRMDDDESWLLAAEPGLYTKPKTKFDSSLVNVLSAVALDLDLEHHRAGHDLLTRLPNRRGLQDAIEREVSRARRASSRFAVVGLDVVAFKRFNDRYGYEVGDSVLRAVADALRAEARATDVVGRWGGDEFVVIALVDTAEELHPLLRRVRERLARREPVGGEPVEFRVGAPVVYPDDGTEPAQLLATALASVGAARRLPPQPTRDAPIRDAPVG
jgi:diguanylate cyclase (GGDEF)-like protein